jgi:hypothetical protein
LIFDTACDLAWSSITYFRNEIFFWSSLSWSIWYSW